MNKKYVNIALITLLFCATHNSGNGVTDKNSEHSTKERQKNSNKKRVLGLLTTLAFAKSYSRKSIDVEGFTAVFARSLSAHKNKPVLENPIADISGSFITIIILKLAINGIEKKVSITTTDNPAVRLTKGLVAGGGGEELWSRLSRFLVDKGVLRERK